jgi:hypothetical protein
MFGSSDPAASGALDAVNDLVTQQQYEYQRAIANMQLIIHELQTLVDSLAITFDSVGSLEALHTDIKHPLRNARHELTEVENILSDVQRTMLTLDFKDGQ